MDQGRPRPSYQYSHEIQCMRNRKKAPTLPFKDRALCWETCESLLQIRRKSEVEQGSYFVLFIKILSHHFKLVQNMDAR